MAYNEHWSSCRLALRFNGSDGATTTTDDKGGTVSLVASGGATVALSNEYYDSAPTSLRSFDKDAWGEVTLSGAAELGAGPLTIAATVRPGSLPTDNWYNILFSNQPSLPSNIQLRLFVAGPHWVGLDVQTPFESVFIMAASVITVGALNRIMATRDAGGTWRLFVNGALVGSSAGAAAVIGLQSPFLIGYHGGDNAADYPAWLDELYIVDGVALETAAYTPAAIFDSPPSGGGSGASSLPLSVAVRTSGASSLPLIISTGVTGSASMGIDVAVVDAAYLSGAALASDGGTVAGSWSPVVTIGGVNRTTDIIGEIDIDAGRGAARIASFALKASGTIDPTTLVGQRVSIDIATAAGTNRMRLFAGRINEPRLDMVGGTIAVNCTDDLQNVINAMPRAALDALIGGRWSAAVFDDAAAGWVYAQDRLSTVPASLDLSPWGALRVTPLEAGAADLSFDGNTILQQSVSVSLAARSGLVNEVAVDFGYRFPMAKRESFNVVCDYMTSGFGPWIADGNSLLLVSSVYSAIEAAGGVVQSIDYTPPPTGTTLYISNGAFFFYVNNPQLPPVCLDFSAVVTFDYKQDVTERHQIIVRSPASIAAMGTLRETVSGALRGETADTLATETNAHLWQLGLSNIPPVDAPAIVIGQTTAEAMTLTTDTNRAAAEAALATLVDVAKVKIIASHQDTTVAAAVALHPLIDLDKTIAIDAQGVTATGRVSRVRHRMSASDSGEAVTEFEISLCRLSGIGIADVETPTAAPAGVADGATGALAPVVCTFNGLSGQDQSFEITFPAVEASQREAAEVVIESAFDVALVEDALIIDMGA